MIVWAKLTGYRLRQKALAGYMAESKEMTLPPGSLSSNILIRNDRSFTNNFSNVLINVRAPFSELKSKIGKIDGCYPLDDL